MKGRASAAESLAGAPGPHFAPKAKHVIYLHMVGGPPQMDLYDYKPVMQEWYDKDLPDSVRMGQRLTTMTSGQKRFPIAPSKFKFAQHGKSGTWVSELLPHTAKVVDDIVWVYPAPVPQIPAIANYLCFFNEHVDVVLDGVLQERPKTKWS
jgi:hypothetical protein